MKALLMPVKLAYQRVRMAVSKEGRGGGVVVLEREEEERICVFDAHSCSFGTTLAETNLIPGSWIL